jgi:hypothetical protein
MICTHALKWCCSISEDDKNSFLFCCCSSQLMRRPLCAWSETRCCICFPPFLSFHSSFNKKKTYVFASALALLKVRCIWDLFLSYRNCGFQHSDICRQLKISNHILNALIIQHSLLGSVELCSHFLRNDQEIDIRKNKMGRNR